MPNDARVPERDRAEGSVVELVAAEGSIDELSARYQSNRPHPHIVLDDVLPIEVARRAAREFDELPSDRWNYYGHYTDQSYSCMGNEHLPDQLRAIVRELQGRPVVALLERLSGIDGLLPDPEMRSCGLLLMRPGHYKFIHADYQIHATQPRWLRRVNLLLYFNEAWKDEYNGHLVLGDPDRSTDAVRITPLLNRCVVFTTTRETLHGVPDRIACPPGMARKVLMLQYYTEERQPPAFETSVYRAPRALGRRGDLIVRAENRLLWLYWLGKRKLGISDRPAGVVFGLVRRLRGLPAKRSA